MTLWNIVSAVGLDREAETGDDTEDGPDADRAETDEVDTLGGRDSADDSIDIGTDALLDTLPQPAFIVDTDHRVVGWNREMEVLTGVDREAVIGRDGAAEFFRDDRSRTLANAVVDDPDSAEGAFGAERSGRDQRAYETERELENAEGEGLVVHSVATPVYQQGRLQGVMQLVQDNTEIVRRREAMDDLVDEVAETAEALDEGNLDARVDFTDGRERLEEEVLEITATINSIAGSTQRTVAGLVDEIGELSEAAARIADATAEVDQQVSEQNVSIRSINDEMQELSATMEEVAASSDQVASAANRAEEAAEKGASAGESARSEMEDVEAATAELVETVEELETRMEAIDEVIDVIAEIADETNILALNASIEAARADASGDGFEVVAEEVKALATETKENATEISERIAAIQEHTRRTVESTEATNERVRSTSEEIEGMLDALEEIVSASREAADGIGEVAKVNDEQAASVEEVTATSETLDEGAREIEERIGTVTELTAEQRDAIDDMIDYLDRLSGEESVDRAATGRIEAAADRIDEADVS